MNRGKGSRSFKRRLSKARFPSFVNLRGKVVLTPEPSDWSNRLIPSLRIRMTFFFLQKFVFVVTLQVSSYTIFINTLLIRIRNGNFI